MPRNLIELIKASGKAGLPGQSFGGFVTGAANLAKMTDYLCASPSFTTGLPAPPSDGIVYASPTVLTLGVVFATYGSRFFHIRQSQSGAWLTTLSFFSSAEPLEASNVVVNDVVWDSGATNALLTVTVNGPFDQATFPVFAQAATASTIWSAQFETPTPLPVGTARVVVRPNTFQSTTAGTETLNLRLQYDPDEAFFNRPQDNQTPVVQMLLRKRSYPSWSVMHEWRIYATPDTSDATGQLLGIDGFDFTSDPGTTFTGYIKYRRRTDYNNGVEAAWITTYNGNPLLVSWTDTRPAT